MLYTYWTPLYLWLFGCLRREIDQEQNPPEEPVDFKSVTHEHYNLDDFSAMQPAPSSVGLQILHYVVWSSLSCCCWQTNVSGSLVAIRFFDQSVTGSNSAFKSIRLPTFMHLFSCIYYLDTVYLVEKFASVSFRYCFTGPIIHSFVKSIHPSIHWPIRPSNGHPSISASILPSVHPSASQATRPSIYQPIYPSINPPMHPSINPWVRLSILPSIHTSTHPSIGQFVHPSIHPSIHPWIHPYINPSIHPSIHRSIDQSIHTSIYPFIHQSIYLSTHPYFLPSVHPWNTSDIKFVFKWFCLIFKAHDYRVEQPVTFWSEHRDKAHVIYANCYSNIQSFK